MRVLRQANLLKDHILMKGTKDVQGYKGVITETEVN